MIDLAASHRHYLEHLLPVWRALPAEERGVAYLAHDLRSYIPGSFPIEQIIGRDHPLLVAGFDDVRVARSRPIILMEHGVGQSYGGDPASAGHPAYAGGQGRHGIAGFLCPNEYAAARNRAANPDAFVEVVGSPRIAALQAVPPPPPPGEIPVVAVSFHWQCSVSHETQSGWQHWGPAVEALARSGEFEVLGHAHPRMFRDLAPTYRAFGIEPVDDFTQILMRAHVYACDNSSTMFEFAQTRGPVVVLDCPWYRTDVDHGLRFWDAADIGPRIRDRAALPVAVRSALKRRPWPGADERLDRVFPLIGDPAAVAADAAVRASRLTPMKSRGGDVFPRVAPVL